MQTATNSSTQRASFETSLGSLAGGSLPQRPDITFQPGSYFKLEGRKGPIIPFVPSSQTCIGAPTIPSKDDLRGLDWGHHHISFESPSLSFGSSLHQSQPAAHFAASHFPRWPRCTRLLILLVVNHATEAVTARQQRGGSNIRTPPITFQFRVSA